MTNDEYNELSELVADFKIDLNKINAPNPPLLSVPTVFIIGKDYTITYRFFDPEHKKRINVNDILTQF